GHVVQEVTWASDRAFDQRPFTDTTALREAFQDAVLTGTTEQQTELLNAFHDLGAEDDTGQVLAVDHVALSNLDEEDHQDVVSLAAAYREHFGFPLIICARETERFDRVLRNGWSRIDNSAATEKAYALIEVAKIANYRFTDLVADANPIAAARFGRLNELS
ncbi:MAG: 2-oxo-4-hydroxy-4-carboxy-5-ureidoimidazoline decarboxylase, partial [Microbacteriaceae bacterium]